MSLKCSDVDGTAGRRCIADVSTEGTGVIFMGSSSGPDT